MSDKKIEEMKELYKKAESAKVGSKILCACGCGVPILKTSYQTKFHLNKGIGNCKDKYWQAVRKPWKKVTSSNWAKLSEVEKAEHILKQDAKVKSKFGIMPDSKVGSNDPAIKVFAVYCGLVQVSNWHTDQFEALTEAGASLQSWQKVLDGGKDEKTESNI